MSPIQYHTPSSWINARLSSHLRHGFSALNHEVNGSLSSDLARCHPIAELAVGLNHQRRKHPNFTKVRVSSRSVSTRVARQSQTTLAQVTGCVTQQDRHFDRTGSGESRLGIRRLRRQRLFVPTQVEATDRFWTECIGELLGLERIELAIFVEIELADESFTSRTARRIQTSASVTVPGVDLTVTITLRFAGVLCARDG